jgi:hypothetical protein
MDELFRASLRYPDNALVYKGGKEAALK